MTTTETLDRAKDQLADRKRKLEMHEKLLREKERKVKARAVAQCGRLVEKAELLDFDSELLLGALLEIRDQATDSSTIERWRLRAQKYQQNSVSTPLIVAPSGDLTKDLRQLMKSLGFRWNSFRKEWYGHGNLQSVKEATSEYSVKIEVVDS